jgi:hypothetical protein
MRIVEGENYKLYCADNRDVIPTLTGIGAIITDPPYGIAHPVNYKSRGRGKLAGCRDYGKPVWANPSSNNYPQIVGDNEPFDPSPLLSVGVPSVLWGANYFASKLPDTCCAGVHSSGLKSARNTLTLPQSD